jgi:hypothetical protein
MGGGVNTRPFVRELEGGTMQARALLGLALVTVSLGVSGCAAALVGAGAAGGFALGKDSVKNHFDLPQEHVYRQSLAVAKQLGLVTLEDETHGKIQMTVDSTTVTITVKPLTKKTVELKVKARDKFLMPKVDVAQDVYNEMAEHLQ